MDRLYYLETSSLVQEKIIYSNKGIRLYDGSNKVQTLKNHQLFHVKFHFLI